MDYKELINALNRYSAENQNHGGVTAQAADAITDLLARAEAAEARCAEFKRSAERWERTSKNWENNWSKELEIRKTAESRAEKAERERDAAIQYMRKTFGWCTGCVHFTGIYGSGCKIGEMSTCGEENNRYVFCEEE